MGKDKAYNVDIQEGTDLNDIAETVPNTKKAGAKAALITLIENELADRYQFRYNLVKNAVEVSTDEQHWTDLDERKALQLEAELMRLGFRGIQRALHVVWSTAPEFDPINNYLKGLPEYAGQDHINHLASFVEVEPGRRDWFNLMFKKHLVRTLACALGRVAFNKHCFVLVSGQNDGKTSFLRFLCPPAWREYYTEDIDFENKDGLIALARNVFINLDELRNLSRQDINKVKSYLSKDHIKARLPFDRRETKLRRNASFFGSTNNAEFLTDETGNVRWLVFEIKGIRHDNGGKEGYIGSVNIDLVYAQALHLLNSDFHYQLTREEILQSETYNKAHLKKPAEYELLLTHYELSTDKNDFKTCSELQRYLQIETGVRLSAEYIGRACRMLGFDRISKKVNGSVIYGYRLKEIAARDWSKVDDGNE